MSKTKSPHSGPATSSKPQGVIQIGCVKAIRSKLLGRILTWLPIAMLVATPLIVWPSNPLRIPGREMFLTGYLSTALALFAFQVLMRQIADAFTTIWSRGLIAEPSNQSTAGDVQTSSPVPPEPKRPSEALTKRYRDYLVDVETNLNGVGQWVLAGIFTALVLTWYVYSFSLAFLHSPILLLGILAEVSIGFVVGLMAWRMLFVGWTLYQLPNRFDLLVQIGHPDKCGGLEPLGNVCLWNALITAVAGVFLGGWIAIGPYTPYQHLAQLYAPIFRWLLVLPVLYSFGSFLLPLWSTHRLMVVKKAALLGELDTLAQQIHEEDINLLKNAGRLDPAQGEEGLKKLELMRTIYDQNRRIPTWPINLDIFVKFLTSQAVPVLTLFGVAEPVVKVVSSLLAGILPTGS